MIFRPDTVNLIRNGGRTVPWTQFHDMHSGGGTKEPPYERIYIEAPEDEARVIFYNRFGHNPDRVSCTCCGDDYSVSESTSFAQASGYERGCKILATPRDSSTLLYQQPDDPWWHEHYWLEPKDEDEAVARGWEIRDSLGYHPDGYQAVDDYIRNPDVLVIREADIKPEERTGTVPQEGYVWMG